MNNRDILSSCIAEIDSRRQHAENVAQTHLDELIRTYPEFASLDRELRSTAGKLVAVLRGSQDINAGLDRIQNENLAVQKRRKDFLASIGLDSSYIEPQYRCKQCSDTGFSGNERCECLKSLLNAAACKRLNDESPLSLCSFDTFDLRYYDGDDAQHMRGVLEFVREYADTFGEGSGNLLFYGNTGLGKTHLSLAVADAVIKKGYNAVYGQAQKIFNDVAEERFSRDASGDTETSLTECDLLIIDDLGAEFVNQLTQSVLYSVINTRLLTGKSTIISTNIPLDQLDGTYHSRICSRLCFEFEPVPFVGKDIRQKRKRSQAL